MFELTDGFSKKINQLNRIHKNKIAKRFAINIFGESTLDEFNDFDLETYPRRISLVLRDLNSKTKTVRINSISRENSSELFIDSFDDNQRIKFSNIMSKKFKLDLENSFKEEVLQEGKTEVKSNLLTIQKKEIELSFEWCVKTISLIEYYFLYKDNKLIKNEESINLLALKLPSKSFNFIEINELTDLIESNQSESAEELMVLNHKI